MDDEVQVPATHADVFRSTVRGAEPITTVTTNSSDAGMSFDDNEVPEWDGERFGRLLTQAVEKTERRKGLKDGRPHRVEVDGGCHDTNGHLIGCEFRKRNLANFQTLAGVLVTTRHSLKHSLIFTAHKDRTRCSGKGKVRQCLRISTGPDGIEKFAHGVAGYP